MHTPCSCARGLDLCVRAWSACGACSSACVCVNHFNATLLDDKTFTKPAWKPRSVLRSNVMNLNLFFFFTTVIFFGSTWGQWLQYYEYYICRKTPNTKKQTSQHGASTNLLHAPGPVRLCRSRACRQACRHCRGRARLRWTYGKPMRPNFVRE